MEKSFTIIRLIALWIIFIISLGAILYSANNTAQHILGLIPVGPTYYTGPSSYNYCLQSPIYPNQMYPTPEMSKEYTEKFAKDLEKYNKETEEFNKKTEIQCKAELLKQEQADKNNQKYNYFIGIGNILSNLVMLILSLIIAKISYQSIKKSEIV